MCASVVSHEGSRRRILLVTFLTASRPERPPARMRLSIPLALPRRRGGGTPDGVPAPPGRLPVQLCCPLSHLLVVLANSLQLGLMVCFLVLLLRKLLLPHKNLLPQLEKILHQSRQDQLLASRLMNLLSTSILWQDLVCADVS